MWSFALLLLASLTITPGRRAAVVVIAVGGLWGGQWLGHRWESATPRPAALGKYVSVAFLGAHANYFLAETIGTSQRDYSESFDTLFVEVQRFGLQPRFERSLPDALERDGVIVVPLVYPSFSDAELSALAAWVRSGHVLWVMSGRDAKTLEGVQQVLDGVGLPKDVLSSGTTAAPLYDAAEVLEGGRLRAWRCGNGLLCVGERAESFSRAGMGHPFPVPTDKTRPKYAVVDGLLQLLQEHLGLSEQTRFGGK